MKKSKLLALAAAAFLGLNANAQIAAGDYFIQNVEAGTYLNGANDWGTKASVTKHGQLMTVAVSGSGYTIDSHISNGGNNHYVAAGDNTYTDGAAASHTITNLGDGVYTIQDPSGKYLIINDGTKVNFAGDAVTDGAKWRFISKDDLLNSLSAASESKPIDVTALIGDANFSRNNQYKGQWQTKSFDGTAVTANKNLGGGNNDNMCAESWRSSNGFNIYQTLELPAGTYELRAQAAMNNYDNLTENLPVVYANNGKDEVSSVFNNIDAGESSLAGMSTSFTNGKYSVAPITIKVTTGVLTIGVKSSLKSVWATWDNFELYCLEKATNVDLTPYQEGYDDVVKTAKAKTSEVMSASALTTLQNAIDANVKDFGTFTSAEEINAAKKALEEAINDADVSIANYKAAKKLLDMALYLDVEGQRTFNSNATVQAVQVAYKGNSLEAVTADQESAINAAYASLAEDHCVNGADLTCLINNPSFETGNFNGWTNVKGFQTQTNASFEKTGNVYCERWHVNTDLNIEQNLTLPTGKYKLTVHAFNDAATATIFAGNQEVAIEGAAKDYEIEVETTTGDLLIGVRGKLTSSTWVCLDNFRLTLLEKKEADLSELKASLEDAVANAEKVSGKMNATVAKTLSDAINAGKKTYTAANDYKTATKNVNDAITAAENSIKAYEAAKTALDAQKALVDGTNVYGEGYDAYKTAYESLQAKYDNNTLADEVVVNPNAITGWHSSIAYNFLLSPWKIGGTACGDEFKTGLYINTWSTEGNTDGSNFQVPFFEYWIDDANSLANNTLSAEVNVPSNGLYKVSVLTRVRAKNGVAATEATGIALKVNDGEAVDATDGDQVGETQFSLATVEAEGLVKDGILRIALEVEGANISWLSFKDVKYTKVRDLTPEEKIVYATAGEIATFNDDVKAAEDKTIGFEKGEYAPYNNIEAVKALAAAKAIDTENPVDIEVIKAAQSALTSATWSVNADEVNAIYDGGFSKTTAQSGGYLVPTGWTNLGYNTRVYNQTNKGENAGVDAGSEGGCLFAKFTTTYGEVAGYEMPLKAGAYSLSFIYGGWNEVGTRDIKVYKKEDASVAATVDPVTVTAENNQAHKSKDSWSSYNGIVTIPSDGNYVLSFYRQSTSSQNQICVSDIKLVKAILPTSVSLNKTAVELEPNETVTLEATVAPSNASIKDVTWTTSDDKVATVENGVVTAVAEGTATITATCGSVKATATITVKAPEPVIAQVTDGVASAAQTADGVEYTRNFANTEWQGLVVPFDINVNDNSDFTFAALENANVDEDADNYYVSLKFNKNVTTITAGTPALVKAKSTGIQVIKGTGSVVAPANKSNDMGNGFSIVGLMESTVVMKPNFYAMAGGALCNTLASNVELPINRWYLAQPVGEPKARIRIEGLDDVTAIDAISNAASSEKVYTISGVEVDGSNLRPGMYIQNGKKVIRK